LQQRAQQARSCRAFRSRPASPLGEQIARNLLDAFYVDTSSWQEAIYGRTADFVARAARALAMP
jgi:hypothetical protein